MLASGRLDKKLSSSNRTSVKVEKPSTGAHNTEVSSVFQKSAKREESGALAKILEAIPGIKDEHPPPPTIGASVVRLGLNEIYIFLCKIEQ